MAFETYEESAQSSSKIELYTLALGSSIYRMHTSVESEITYAGDIYYRTQVSREAIMTGQEYLKIMLPGSHNFVLKYVSIAPGQTASLTIRE